MHLWVAPALFLAVAVFVPFGRAIANVHTYLPEFLATLYHGLSPQTQIFFPTDENWTTEAQRYTVHDAPRYIASVKPATESDVQKIVSFCSNFNIPFLATGGGHGFATTFKKLKQGIKIDLGFFKDVSVDAKANTLTIGGGTVFSDVWEPVYKAGKEIQTGSCPCVGMVGATVGGGVGRYNGLHGMILDALLSVRIVTANRIVTASETENSDLFWGIRGAGMNYGVILSATYRVYDLTSSTIMNADVDLPLNSSKVVMNYLKKYEDSLPAKLALTLRSSYSTDTNKTFLTFNAVYAGPQEEGQALIEPILKANPIRCNVSEVQWSDMIAATFWGEIGCQKSVNANLYGIGIKTYDLNTFETFFADWDTFLQANPDTQEGSIFYMEAFPTQAVRAVPNNATAYPHRDISAHVLFNFDYPAGNAALENTINTFGVKFRSQFQATSGFDELKVYVSYGHGDEGVVPLYGQQNLPRLEALKKKWDPKNLFRFNEPLV